MPLSGGRSVQIWPPSRSRLLPALADARAGINMFFAFGPRGECAAHGFVTDPPCPCVLFSQGIASSSIGRPARGAEKGRDTAMRISR